ncbi:unnamed protein product, partial [Prorocentrum cordatum]
ASRPRPTICARWHARSGDGAVVEVPAAGPRHPPPAGGPARGGRAGGVPGRSAPGSAPRHHHVHRARRLPARAAAAAGRRRPVAAAGGRRRGAAGGALWWKLPLAGAGNHIIRVTDIGTPVQQLVLDGALVEAPEGTLAFTGPAGTFLELRPAADGSWLLLADGTPVPSYDPAATAEPPITWSFVLPTGTHFLQALNLGKRGQEISLDGVPIVAPDGEVAFTGPGGALLQLASSGGDCWTLFVDGVEVQSSTAGLASRCADGVYTFSCQGRAHRLQVAGMGESGQQVVLDGELIPAPPGTTCFTGPGGCLLELRPETLGWALYMDGSCVAVGESAPSPQAFPMGIPVTPVPPPPAPAPVAPRPPPAPVLRGGIAPTASQAMPQGVSLDTSTGMYTANIRVRGKFRFLGEFRTPEEASQRYQQARSEF